MADLGKRFKNLAELLDEIATKEEVVKLFKTLTDFVKEARTHLETVHDKLKEDFVKEATTALETVSNEHKEKLSNEVKDVSGRQLEAEKRLSKGQEDNNKLIYSESRTLLRLMEQKVADLKEQIPEGYEDSELRRELENIRAAIPEVPPQFDPSTILSDLTNLIQKVEKLEKDIEELKKRPIGTIGGGVTNMRIQQAFKYILKTEQPSGLINGSNTAYTVTQPIFAVLSFSLNGETIAQLPNYTISNKTITFSSALPAAYSGKDFEVKYI